jgi:hypothetical protein
MRTEGLTDLEELIHACHDSQSREYIREAVACYKAGAYRSAIVATWNAVVYDFLHKLRLLEMTGHGDARDHLKKYKAVLEMSDEKSRKAKLMGFEDEVLTLAENPFEFITPLEAQDLNRLHHDRNRCAHPSLHALDEPFLPSAELARYHLRNAVAHFLAHAPAQGKAAVTAIFLNVDAREFPTDTKTAREFFASGHLLSNARSTLVKDVLTKLVGALIGHDQELGVTLRYYAAHNAVLELYPAVGEEVLAGLLPRKVETLKTEEMKRVVTYLNYVRVAWDWMGNAGQIKVQGFINTVDAESGRATLEEAHAIPQLRKAVRERLRTFSEDELIAALENAKDPSMYAEGAVLRFQQAENFAAAQRLGNRLIIPLAEFLTTEQVRLVLEAFLDNSQIYHCFRMASVMERLLGRTSAKAEELKDAWAKVHDRITRPTTEKNYAHLALLLKRKYPELRPEGWKDPYVFDGNDVDEEGDDESE